MSPPRGCLAEALFANQEEIELERIYADPVHDFGFFRYDPGSLRHIQPNSLPLVPEGAQVGREIRVVGNDAGDRWRSNGSAQALWNDRRPEVHTALPGKRAACHLAIAHLQWRDGAIEEALNLWRDIRVGVESPARRSFSGSRLLCSAHRALNSRGEVVGAIARTRYETAVSQGDDQPSFSSLSTRTILAIAPWSSSNVSILR